MKRILAAVLSLLLLLSLLPFAAIADDKKPASDVQIAEYGGSVTSTDGSVTVSKTIKGTDIENVFDITLTASSNHRVTDFAIGPDAAVMIVLDCSNSMNTKPAGWKNSKVDAAISSAKDFITAFGKANALRGKIGLVCFNTNSYLKIPLTSCSNPTEAAAISGQVESLVTGITSAAGYRDSRNRYTNIEGGLLTAKNALDSVTNENKYIIFLSDGFPTTYNKSASGTGYTGYEPYTSAGTVGKDGVFYDSVKNSYCSGGTSYSDKGAIKARIAAANVKNAGITIFPVGIDVANMKIGDYEGNSPSIIDRSGSTYEIGAADSTDAFKTWLTNSIGSGIYYDSSNESGLKVAYDDILSKITVVKEVRWSVTDPVPNSFESGSYVEFLGFYDKSGVLQQSALTGEYAENKENTASFDTSKSSISWDISKSGYTVVKNGSTTTYSYSLTYRVRLENESAGFAEKTKYDTNGKTTLHYQYFDNIEGVGQTVKESDVEFPVPAVEGFLADLSFTKIGRDAGDPDDTGKALSGAVFTLTHDPNCAECAAMGHTVSVGPFSQTSAETDGTVSFQNIPSGHSYIMTESGVPSGYSAPDDTYKVVVSYDVITVTVTHKDSTTETWSGTGDTVENFTDYTVTYHVAGDEKYGIPGESAGAPEPDTGIPFKGSDNLQPLPTTSWTTSNGNPADAETDPGIPGTWVFAPEDGWSETEDDYEEGVTELEDITEDRDVYGKWEFVPETHKVTYHVEGDDTYGIPGESAGAPDPDTGIPYGESDTLKDRPTTDWNTSTGKNDGGVVGTWTFVPDTGWSETEGDYEEGVTKLENITEDRDVYGKWEFTPTPLYNVDHEFQSATPGKTLPDAVLDLVPADQIGVPDGSTVYPTEDFPIVVKVPEGQWEFVYWDEDSKIIEGADQHFIGYWVFVEPSNHPPRPGFGHLTISKTVEGDGADLNAYFTFTVTFDAEGDFAYAGDCGQGRISSGGSIRLKHGQSVTIYDLPEGTNYIVTESDNEGYRVSSVSGSGIIRRSHTIYCEFTNTKIGSAVPPNTPPVKGSPSGSNLPFTGDSTEVAVWIILMVVSLLEILGVEFIRRKKARPKKACR